eukprot:scaffold552668_cov29-Prasinocladus_malaysianus.AAC.1
MESSGGPGLLAVLRCRGGNEAAEEAAEEAADRPLERTWEVNCPAGSDGVDEREAQQMMGRLTSIMKQ